MERLPTLKSLAVSAAALLALLLAAGPAAAGSLTVQAASKHAGNFGLKAAIGTCASMADLTVPAQDLSGTATFEGCETLTTSGAVHVVSGSSTFRAGRTLSLANGFQVASGATFHGEIQPTISRAAFVQDESPTAEKTYWAEFYARFDSLSFSSGDVFDHFIGYKSDGVPQLRLRIKRNTMVAENRLIVDARLDNGTYVSTEGLNTEVMLTAGWHKIEATWKAATSAGANNGSVDLYVDNTLYPTALSGLDNDTAAIDFVQWGSVATVSAGITGFMDLDEFASGR